MLQPHPPKMPRGVFVHPPILRPRLDAPARTLCPPSPKMPHHYPRRWHLCKDHIWQMRGYCVSLRLRWIYEKVRSAYLVVSQHVLCAKAWLANSKEYFDRCLFSLPSFVMTSFSKSCAPCPSSLTSILLLKLHPVKTRQKNPKERVYIMLVIYKCKQAQNEFVDMQIRLECVGQTGANKSIME